MKLVPSALVLQLLCSRRIHPRRCGSAVTGFARGLRVGQQPQAAAESAEQEHAAQQHDGSEAEVAAAWQWWRRGRPSLHSRIALRTLALVCATRSRHSERARASALARAHNTGTR